MSNEKCVDCSVEEGQLHKWGCESEMCPFCGGQRISCSCYDDLMDLIFLRPVEGIVDRFTDAEKQRWIELIGDMGPKWKEVLDSPFETIDMMEDTPPDWCNTYEQFEAFKQIKKTFDEADVPLDYKWEEFCNEKGRIPFFDYDPD